MFLFVGKLCLQHEDLAKKVVAALARELETSTDPAIRNNVVIVLCDLCVRYVTMETSCTPARELYLLCPAVRCCHTVLQIRRANRDNLEIILLISL